MLAVSEEPQARSLTGLLLVALVLLVAATAARAAVGSPSLRVLGTAVALTAAWLLPQRDDVGSALILAALFGAGTGLVSNQLSPLAAAVPAAVVPAIALLVVRGYASPGAMALIAAAAVLAALALGAGRPTVVAGDVRHGYRRTVASVLVIATIVFTAVVGSETPGAHWFGGGITNGPAAARDVAITFDDGPNPSSTLQIARILDAAGAKGTFFEVGRAIDADPAITRALYADGQGLGNHSYHHDQWRWLDPRYPELERTQKAFERAINVCPAFYRPPHGERTPFLAHVVGSHHMRMVMWDDSSGDWALKDPVTIARRTLSNVHPGSIIVLHDGLDGNPRADRSVLVRAMPLILDGLRSRGLHPVRLDRLIGGPAFRPCR